MLTGMGAASSKTQIGRVSAILLFGAAFAIAGLIVNQAFSNPPPTVSYVTFSYSPATQIVTLAGDAGSNNVNVTLKSGVVTATAGGSTKIVTSSGTGTSFSYHTGPLFTIVGTFGDKDDYVTFNSISSSAVTLSLGGGDDQARFTYCGITNLTVDGGAGTDTLVELATKITTPAITNVEKFWPLQ